MASSKAAPRGRYVRIESPGEERTLSLAEVQRRQVARPWVYGIADILDFSGGPEHPLDRPGERKVHVGDPGGQHIGGVGAPLLAAACAQAVDVEDLEVQWRIPHGRVEFCQERPECVGREGRRLESRSGEAADEVAFE